MCAPQILRSNYMFINELGLQHTQRYRMFEFVTNYKDYTRLNIRCGFRLPASQLVIDGAAPLLDFADDKVRCLTTLRTGAVGEVDAYV